MWLYENLFNVGEIVYFVVFGGTYTFCIISIFFFLLLGYRKKGFVGAEDAEKLQCYTGEVAQMQNSDERPHTRLLDNEDPGRWRTNTSCLSFLQDAVWLCDDGVHRSGHKPAWCPKHNSVTGTL